MTRTWHFAGWSVRNKLAALIVVVSLVPLVIATALDIRWQRQLLLSGTSELLRSNAAQLVSELDGFTSNYQHVADRLGHVPDIARLMQAPAQDPRADAAADARDLLQVLPANDRQVLAVAVLDPHGHVLAASDPRLEGSTLPAYDDAERQQPGTQLRLAEAALGSTPAIIIAKPVAIAGRPAGVTVLWIRATGLWDLMKAANDRAGPGSRAVLLDRGGIRIGHSASEEMLFHPAASLDAVTLRSMIDDRRFGEHAEELLSATLEFPELRAHAALAAPDSEPFVGASPFSQSPNMGVARRLNGTGWTIVYLVPREGVLAAMSQISRRTALLASAIKLLAGTACAASILSPVRSLSVATARITAGDLSARAQVGRGDEISQLAESFNAMATRIEEQARQVLRSHDELEARVRERTAELARTTQTLQSAVQECIRAQQLLKGIVDSTDDAVISKTLDGTILTWNPAAETLFGHTAAQAIGKPMMLILPPERMEEEQDILRRIARGESVRHFETLGGYHCRQRAPGERVRMSGNRRQRCRHE